jgi:putative tryptophan/tyrosine transport system substrate-binding protein
MTVTIGRRELLVALGGAAATWPLTARAQQTAMPIIGFLNGASSWEYAHLAAVFRQGLTEAGYVEGRNVFIEYRWAEGHYDRLPHLAADLVRRQVAVIFANGPAVVAAKAATTTIPIVFATALDPVGSGLVASLNRPGGNLTGATSLLDEIGPKRLGLMHELVPTATAFAALINPTFPSAKTQSRDLEAAAHTLGLQLHVVHAVAERDLDTAFATLGQLRLGGLVICPDPFFSTRIEQLAELTVRHAVPAIYQSREFVAAGGLMSYGAGVADTYRQAGIYVGRILKGEKAADLPVQQVTKVELVLNMKTAKALGLTFPLSLLGRADEVIE